MVLYGPTIVDKPAIYINTHIQAMPLAFSSVSDHLKFFQTEWIAFTSIPSLLLFFFSFLSFLQRFTQFQGASHVLLQELNKPFTLQRLPFPAAKPETFSPRNVEFPQDPIHYTTSDDDPSLHLQIICLCLLFSLTFVCYIGLRNKATSFIYILALIWRIL